MSRPDQRTDPRMEMNAAASLQMLGTTASANGQARAVTVVDVSDRGMRLLSAAPMDAGQAVKVEVGDAMFLGEVCYCAATQSEPVIRNSDKQFYLGVVTTQCLTGLASLHHLIRALSPEAVEELEPQAIRHVILPLNV